MIDAAPPHQDRRVLALALRLIAMLIFGTMNVLLKKAGDAGVKLPEIMFWRMAVATPIILVWASIGPGLGALKTKRFSAHVSRTSLGLLGMATNFGSLLLLPIAEQTTILFAFPLFATLLGVLFLGERVGLQRWLAVVLGFVGVVIVVQPGNNSLPFFGSLIALSSAFIVAIVNLQIRDIARTESSTAIVFWFSTLAIAPLGLLMPFYATAHGAGVWAMLIGTGALGALGQLALTHSLKYAPVSVVVNMDYLGILLATFYGWVFWDHLPPASMWIGGPIIIGSAAFIAWRERRLEIERSRELM